jgi:16S rRNA C1402 N4-methylase RsmH
MLRLTELAHRICRQVLKEGDCVVDATVGNGHDTLFLVQAAGSSGHVYGFDIQPEALEQTRERLKGGDTDRVTLIAGSHADMGNLIPTEHHGRIKLVMFNLGYLPGGNKQITTQTQTTLAALAAACRLLDEQGLITIIAYPGHEGGTEETAAIEEFLKQKQDEGWHVECFKAVQDSETAPRLFVLSRQSLEHAIPN